MSEAVKKAAETVRRWVTFRLAGEIYGIDVMAVQEVIRVPETVPVPGAPPFIIGIINLRGNVVTVIDSHRIFALPPCELGEASRIVIVEAGKQIAGLLVDSVAEVVNIANGDIETAPDVGTTESAKYIQGITHHNNELLILVDVNRLLTPEQWSEVAAV